MAQALRGLERCVPYTLPRGESNLMRDIAHLGFAVARYMKQHSGTGIEAGYWFDRESEVGEEAAVSEAMAFFADGMSLPGADCI